MDLTALQGDAAQLGQEQAAQLHDLRPLLLRQMQRALQPQEPSRLQPTSKLNVPSTGRYMHARTLACAYTGMLACTQAQARTNVCMHVHRTHARHKHAWIVTEG